MSTSKLFAITAALVMSHGYPAAVGASTVYTNEADFVAAIGALPVFVNEFTNLGYVGQMAHPVNACQGNYCYSIYSEPPIHLVAFNGAVSTAETNDQMVANFTAVGVRAVGGIFFTADANGFATSGSASITLSDGTVAEVVTQSNTVSGFLGFVSAGPVITNLVLQGTSPNSYPAISHFYLALAAPSPGIVLAPTNSVILSWPAGLTNFALQSSSEALGGNWTNVEVKTQQNSNSTEVRLPAVGGQGYFRLQQQ